MAELQTQLSNINFMSKERFESLESIDDGQLYAVEFPFTDEDLVHTRFDEEIYGVKTFNDEIYAPNQIDYNNITNCITEIPQDIKFELADGTLTLKAGSKVYVPNGFESDGTTPRFDDVIIESDVSATREDNQDCIAWYNTNTGTMQLFPTILFYSGSTAPSGQQFMFWYDTTNNKCKVTGDSGSIWVEGKSFPLCIVSTDGTKISAITQVFNGFGYIGSTVFALPGVKGLIPNGRNADGGLKNIEVTSTKVIAKDYSTTGGDWVIGLHSSGFGLYKLTYDSDANKNSANNITQGVANAGNISLSSGAITSLTPKFPFRAVDYNDFHRLDNQSVKIIGDQTIDGIKTFTDSPKILSDVADPRITTQFENMKIGEKPTTNYFAGFKSVDKDGVEFANCNCSYNNNERVGCNFYVARPGEEENTTINGTLGIFIDKDGTTAYTSAPQPQNGDNSTKIATTSWVNSNAVMLTNNQTITGAKTFSGTTIRNKCSIADATASTISSTEEKGLLILDINGQRIGNFYGGQNADGNIRTYMCACRPVNGSWVYKYAQIYQRPDGTATFSVESCDVAAAPTPAAGDNSNKIATTNWCYDPAKSTNLVHRTGDETIAGTKTFSSTIQGTAYRALWGDLAEYYETDKEYPRGTLVQFGGSKEITIATDNVNAVITSEPGFILNTQQSFNAENSQAIALVGKVPIRVIGKVNKFDYLTLSDIPGVAQSFDTKSLTTNIVARALEQKDSEEEGLVLCVVKFAL